MRGSERLLALLIAATVVAGIVTVFVKDTEPGEPQAVTSPTPTAPAVTQSPTEPASPSPTATRTREPSPRPSPTMTLAGQEVEPPDLPATGAATGAVLGLFLLLAAGILLRARRLIY